VIETLDPDPSSPLIDTVMIVPGDRRQGKVYAGSEYAREGFGVCGAEPGREPERPIMRVLR
jgi:hypothetical protein